MKWKSRVWFEFGVKTSFHSVSSCNRLFMEYLLCATHSVLGAGKTYNQDQVLSLCQREMGLSHKAMSQMIQKCHRGDGIGSAKAVAAPHV